MSLNFPKELIRASSGGGAPFETSLYDSGNNLLISITTNIPNNWNDFNTPYNATRLEVGTSCTTIGNNAFDSCTGLTGTLTIPDSVTSIGEYAFYLCANLTGSLTIGNNVTTIGPNAFQFLTGLTGDLVIPDNVTVIGYASFYQCTGLTGSLIIPNSVTTIGQYAFYNSNQLTAAYFNCPASSWTSTSALTNTTLLANIYVHTNYVAGYDAAWKTAQGTAATVSTWTNYPTIP
tara:strand:- start:242 stop:940 length:699 start_codon:yes stop_codon:yes gene_type:complete